MTVEHDADCDGYQFHHPVVHVDHERGDIWHATCQLPECEWREPKVGRHSSRTDPLKQAKHGGYRECRGECMPTGEDQDGDTIEP